MIPGRIKEDDPRKAMLSALLQKKTLQHEADFESIENKPSGASAGYVAKRSDESQNSSSKYMLKYSIKPTKQHNEDFDCMGIIHEILTGVMYQRFMYNRAPSITAVVTNTPTNATSYLINEKFLLGLILDDLAENSLIYVYNNDILRCARVLDGQFVNWEPRIDLNPGEDYSSLINNLDQRLINRGECKKLTESEVKLITAKTNHVAGKATETMGLISEFLPGNFKTVSQYTSSKQPSGIGVNWAKLAKVEGAEKLFATMLMLGEHDIHAGNIGVMLENGVPVFAKIDHGWSATQFFTSSDVALRNLAKAFKRYGYLGVVPLDLIKFKAAIDQICHIDSTEINDLLLSKITLLQQMHIGIEHLNMLEWQDDLDHVYDEKNPPPAKTFKNFDSLIEHLSATLTKQLQVMKSISARLEIMTYIDLDEKERKFFSNGRWLQAVDQKPVTWAIRNGKTINHEDPIVWIAGKIVNYTKELNAQNEVLRKLLPHSEQRELTKITEIIDINTMIDDVVDANNIEAVLLEVIKQAPEDVAVMESILKYYQDHQELGIILPSETLNTMQSTILIAKSLSPLVVTQSYTEKVNQSSSLEADQDLSLVATRDNTKEADRDLCKNGPF